MLAYGDRMRRAAIEPEALAAYWVDRVDRLLRACVRDRDLLPADRSVDVLFHEFMADDVGDGRADLRAQRPAADDAATPGASSTRSWPTTRAASTAGSRTTCAGDFGLDPADGARPLRLLLRPVPRCRGATSMNAEPRSISRSSAAARSRTGTSTRSSAPDVPITRHRRGRSRRRRTRRKIADRTGARAVRVARRRARRRRTSTPRSSPFPITCTSRSRPRRSPPGCTCCSRSRSRPTLDACDRILAAARAAGTVFMVAENAQYWPEVLTVRDLIADGAIGDVITARAATFFPALGDFYGGDRPWRFDKRGRGRRRGRSTPARTGCGRCACGSARSTRSWPRSAIRIPTWRASRCAARCCGSSRAWSPSFDAMLTHRRDRDRNRCSPSPAAPASSPSRVRAG